MGYNSNKQKQDGVTQMNNYYIEHCTAQVKSSKETALKALFISLMAFCIIISFFIGLLPIGILLAMLFGFFLRGRDYQYEYILVQDELNVDKIIRKEKRKHITTIPLANAEQMLPASEAMRLTHIQFQKTRDFTSGDPHANVQILVINNGGVKEKVVWEPNSELIDAVTFLMRRR